MKKSQIKRLETCMLRNKERGNTPMPKMTKAQLNARIDAVVSKALSSQQSATGVDVIREMRPMRFRSLKAYRVG